MGKHTRYTAKQVEKMAELRRMGYSYTLIAERFGTYARKVERLVTAHNRTTMGGGVDG